MINIRRSHLVGLTRQLDLLDLPPQQQRNVQKSGALQTRHTVCRVRLSTALNEATRKAKQDPNKNQLDKFLA